MAITKSISKSSNMSAMDMKETGNQMHSETMAVLDKLNRTKKFKDATLKEKSIMRSEALMKELPQYFKGEQNKQTILRL